MGHAFCRRNFVALAAGCVLAWGVSLRGAEPAGPAIATTMPWAPPVVSETAKGKIAAPPESLLLDKFYTKYLDCGGIPVVSSGAVTDYALREAAYIIDQMLAKRPDVRAAMAKGKMRAAVMGYREYTCDIPEYRDLKPKEYWNKRARGLGATPECPVVSGAEENLLCFPGDTYSTENIFLHEFAHAIHEVGLAGADKDFQKKLEACFENSKKNKLWVHTYAMFNVQEYWAEGVQSYFDTNRPKDRIHNGINTRELLANYDPEFYKLIDETFGHLAWRYSRPENRAQPEHLAGYDPAKAPRFEWPIELLRWNLQHHTEAVTAKEVEEAEAKLKAGAATQK